MPRTLPDGVAVYLALTGQRLKAPDLLSCGIATHYVPSAKLDDLEAALITATESLTATSTVKDPLEPVITSFHETPPTEASPLEQEKATIEQVFGPVLENPGHTVEVICDSLAALDTEFGRSTLTTLEKMSPTSLKVTLEGLRRGKVQPSLEADLAMEFRLSQHFMRPGSDFREGIRATLIDKDGNPQWNPATLKEVTDELVESYFEPIEHEWVLPDEFRSAANSSKL